MKIVRRYNRCGTTFTATQMLGQRHPLKVEAEGLLVSVEAMESEFVPSISMAKMLCTHSDSMAFIYAKRPSASTFRRCVCPNIQGAVIVFPHRL